MPLLPNLPTELEEIILSHLSDGGLASLCRLNKEIHAVVEPRLYAKFSNLEERRQHPELISSDQVKLLTRTLRSRPELSQHIKSVQLASCKPSDVMFLATKLKDVEKFEYIHTFDIARTAALRLSGPQMLNLIMGMKKLRSISITVDPSFKDSEWGWTDHVATHGQAGLPIDSLHPELVWGDEAGRHQGSIYFRLGAKSQVMDGVFNQEPSSTWYMYGMSFWQYPMTLKHMSSLTTLCLDERYLDKARQYPLDGFLSSEAGLWPAIETFEVVNAAETTYQVIVRRLGEFFTRGRSLQVVRIHPRELESAFSVLLRALYEVGQARKQPMPGSIMQGLIGDRKIEVSVENNSVYTFVDKGVKTGNPMN